MNLADQTRIDYEQGDLSFDDALIEVSHLTCNFDSDTQVTTVEFCDKSVALFDWNMKKIRTYNSK